LAASPPTTPLVVVTGVNDTFVFTPVATGTPETFTVAAGTYADVDACVAAMAAAVGGSAERFDTIVTPSNDSGSILLTEVAVGGNGDTVTVGASDVSAGLGFASPSTFTANLGLELWTPTIGDLLLTAWPQVDTAWDGTNPYGDIGPFLNPGDGGWYKPLNSGSGVDMTLADAVALLPGILSGNPSNVFDLYWHGNQKNYRVLPGPFTTADPIKIVVSQDGTNTGLDPGATQGSGIVYVVTATPA
jgi:hypothetical protein